MHEELRTSTLCPSKSMWNLFTALNKDMSANESYGDAYMTPFRFPLLWNNVKIWPAKIDMVQRKHRALHGHLSFVLKPRSWGTCLIPPMNKLKIKFIILINKNCYKNEAYTQITHISIMNKNIFYVYLNVLNIERQLHDVPTSLNC